ncbi:MAG TPA: class I SAM-dependent methyltransferase [Candidatus Kapabacteria bacterium]|nr:class I SAM-dependent methyltransferase [Candidatus Kapabacteria bacterium]
MLKDMSESEKIQKELYNKIAPTYDLYYSNDYALNYRYELYRNILKSIELKNLKALDAMCGGGQTTGFLLKNNALVTGLDISESQCEIYKKRYGSCDVVCSSIIETGFPDSYFDLVVMESLHHLYPHTDKGINEIHRILKPGGYFLLWEPCAGSIFDLFRKIWYKIDKYYFEKNERSIDLQKMMKFHDPQFELIQRKYGGNLAYLFVQESMVLRINPKIVNFYAQALLRVEKIVNRIQPPFLSLWVLALLRKK